ncbi:MAG: hydroxyacid dehydrogenase [Chloroflexi bacterium]|nr:hydroxyacid dehydrogenase [Chloroflexota bacterium]
MSDVLVVAPIHEDALQLMRDSGLGVTDARGKSPDEVRELLKTHRALLGRAGVKIDDELLAEARNLRVVAVGSVGMDSLDLPYLYSRGLKVFNAAGGNRNAVAELAVGNAIALLRQTHKANTDLHKGIWPAMFDRPPGNELWQKTVGIVGLGDIGSLAARLFSAFETTVIAYDPYVRYVYDASLRPTPMVEMVRTLDELLRRSDLITVHVPLTDETFHMFSAEQFKQMKPTAFFMNYSRGKVVDEPALADALETQQIAGAAIDVFEVEPATDSVLLGLPNCIVTPHIAGVPREAMRRLGMTVAQRIVNELTS